MWFLIVLFFIISYPLSKLLDFLLGKDTNTFYRRAELKELLDIHEADTEKNVDPLTQGSFLSLYADHDDNDNENDNDNDNDSDGVVVCRFNFNISMMMMTMILKTKT